MKSILLIAALLFSLGVNAQKTRKVIKRSDYPSFQESFYVIKSDKKIKHGEYKKEIRGKLLKKGEFADNKRIGIWEFYDLRDELTHKVDMENENILFDSNPNTEFDKSKYSRPLIFLGGYGAFYSQIANLLRYPAPARRKGTQGKVILKVVFNQEGKLDQVVVTEGLGNGLDEEAVRVIELVDFETLPALDINGKPVESEIILPVTFKLG